MSDESDSGNEINQDSQVSSKQNLLNRMRDKIGQRKFLVQFFIFYVITFSFLIFILLLKYTKTQKISYKTSSSVLPTSSYRYVLPSPNPIPTIEYPKTKRWDLKKKVGSKNEDVLSINNFSENYIVGWNNWLFYNEPSQDGKNWIVYGYDMTNGDKKVVFDESANADKFAGGYSTMDFDQLIVINNTLYFSFGGYLETGAIFWENLPLDGKPQKLTDLRNGRITSWHDSYWLIGGEGDACWGFTEYSLVDLVNKKVTPISTSNTGCSTGEELIAIDTRNRMLLAYHSGDQYTEDEFNNGTNIYEYVIAVPIDNPTQKEGVIAKQNMPEKVIAIYYLPDKNKLFLKGKENYYYDFATNSMTKTADEVKAPDYDVPKIEYKTLEEQIKMLNLPQDYQFNLE